MAQGDGARGFGGVALLFTDTPACILWLFTLVMREKIDFKKLTCTTDPKTLTGFAVEVVPQPAAFPGQTGAEFLRADLVRLVWRPELR